MLDFPNTPTVNSTFTSGGRQWTWDGTKWLPAGQGSIFVPAMNDNRIINGDMRINQRGASGWNAPAGYMVDRWNLWMTTAGKVNWTQGVSGAGTGGDLAITKFAYSLGFKSMSAYAVAASDTFGFGQPIEADMISDLAYGGSTAQPVTLSFWVYSTTVVGLFGGCFQNYAGTRSYPFTYNIPTAATWNFITLTIPGDTAGTWVMNGNAGAAYLVFDLGSGSNNRGPAGAWGSATYNGANGTVSLLATNNAQIYFTGIKLEIGSVATPFNRQSLAKSLMDCQRYFNSMKAITDAVGNLPAGSYLYCRVFYPPMRAAPSINFSNINYSNCSGLASFSTPNPVQSVMYTTVTASGAAVVTADFALNAEL